MYTQTCENKAQDVRVYVPMYHDGSSLYLWHVQSLRPGSPGGASLWLSLSSVPAAESDRG